MNIGQVLRMFAELLIHVALFACALTLVMSRTLPSAERDKPETARALHRAFWTLIGGSAAYVAVMWLCHWYES